MSYEPTHLDLFSGIGGFALAARWAGFRTVAFCEIDRYCQADLKKNFPAHMADSSELQCDGGGTDRESQTRQVSESGERCCAPRIYENIFDFCGTEYRGCNLLTGGFPCQPFSVAGKQRGAEDDRHLWPEMLRVIDEARPAWIVGENVPGIIPMELDNVLSDMETISYAVRPFVIPACAVDAKHRRDRVWIIGRNMAYTSDDGSHKHDSAGCDAGPESQNCQQQRSGGTGGAKGRSGEIPDPSSPRLERQWEVASGTRAQFNDTSDHCRWLPEPGMGRVANGVPRRVDRLRGLGNAIVPQVALEILKEIRKMIP